MPKRRHSTGSVYRVRKLKGLGQLDNPKSWMGAAGPTLIGGAAAALTVVGIRHLVTPTSEMQRKMMSNAPWIGLGVAALSALGMSLFAGQPAAVATVTGGIVVAGAMLLHEALLKPKIAAIAPDAVAQLSPYGLGALVFEPTASRGYGSGMRGMMNPRTGAIVPVTGPSYGDEVNLQGIDPSAFGAQGF